MKPSVAISITDKDNTGPGARSAEGKFAKFASRSSAKVKESGVGRLGKMLKGLGKFGSFSFGAEGLGRIADNAISAHANVSTLTSGLMGAGEAGEGAMGKIATAAGGAAGAIAGVAATAIGLGVAAYMLGDKWAKTGAEVDRTAKTFGVTTDFLQRTRAANERFGVSADATTSSVEGLGDALYEAQYGGNNIALAVLQKEGVQLKKNADGAIDVADAYSKIADVIAKQKNPFVQKKIAGIFGMTGALPAIRQGSTSLAAEGADYASSGAELTDQEVAKSTQVFHKTVTLKQHLGAVEKTAGMASMNVTGAGADVALGAMREGKFSLHQLAEGGQRLVSGGVEAARHLVDGGRDAAKSIREAAALLPAALADRGERMAAYFQQLGYTGEQAHGMAAGAFAESRLNPNAENPTSGAFGIGQWLGKRKKQLFEMYGSNPNFDQQLQFMGWELAHTEAPAARAIQGASTGADAMEAYVRRFMRPAAGAETSGDIHRGDAFLAKTSDGAAPPQPVAKAHVRVELVGAPAGTTAAVSSDPGVDVDMRIAHSMVGP